jgi:hypothetical protein
MKRILHLVIITVLVSSCQANLETSDHAAGKASAVWQDYDRYRELSITNRFFKHSDIVPLIERHAATGMISNTIVGTSTEGRSIHHLTYGQGKTKILLWSQMHGDESTATMALFDLFNFFTSSDEYDSLRDFLLSRLELHFVPMLNPDGAEGWQRRNALDIDVNRDARLQATPEGRILAKIGKELKPEFGFNLHDQSVYYTAGSTRQPATISFLAPAYNYEKDMNEVRARATRLIVKMNRALQTKIPGKVAKYDDAYDPRCFGDSFQGWGTSTILIESGGYPQDVEKQHIRKVNFYALLTAFESIAKGNYGDEPLSAYDTIPENSRNLYDLVIRNVEVLKEDQSFKTHVAINRIQIKSGDYRSVTFRGSIVEMGDLDRQFGYEEIDAVSLKFTPGKLKTMRKKEWEGLSDEEELSLIKQGFLFVKWTDAASPAGPVPDRMLNLMNVAQPLPDAPAPGQSANFLLTRENVPVYAVVNGFVVDLNKEMAPVINAVAY